MTEDIIDLRFGDIVSIYYRCVNQNVPKQLDLLDIWFPDLIVQSEESEEKTEAFYDDPSFQIHAVRYKGKLYTGSGKRVSQITGRLTGTARGNQEKERRTAEEIQKHLASIFLKDWRVLEKEKKTIRYLLDEMDEKETESFIQCLNRTTEKLRIRRENQDEYERMHELFPMDDEVYEGILWNAYYQLNLGKEENIVNAYLWLLLGSLLRNETGRLLHLFDSSFLVYSRRIGEKNTLASQMDALKHPENYGYTFDGDEEDLKRKYPDVTWICDECGAVLNTQKDFDETLPAWKCTVCGHVNRIDYDQIYDNEEDFRNHVNPTDETKFKEALEDRKRELAKHHEDTEK